MLVLLMVGCGQEAEGEISDDATTDVIGLIEEMPNVEKVVEVTAETDPNEMLGRSNGYSEGAVVYDSRLECRQPGIECGAFIEVWEDPADARASSEYTKALQNGMQSLGRTEYHYLQDGP